MSSSRKRALSIDGAERGDGGGRSSERQGKLSRKRKVTVAETEKQEPVKAVSKGKRQAWTAPAMAAFFEGLCEHGKDFGRILHFMQTKHKKKQDAFIGNLNRNQVRFFYYRTWHKVSTLLSTSHKPAAKKLSMPETEPTDSVNSPPPTLPPPPPPPQSLPAPPQSTSQSLPGQPPNSTNEKEVDSLTTAIDMSAPVSGEETEGEAGFDTSLDEVCEEPIESQTCEEEASGTVTAVLRNVFGEGSSSRGPSLANEDSSSVTVVSTTLGSTPDKLPVGCSPKDSRVETKKEKGEGGGMIMVNGIMFSLDLVALICYSKLKQKCGDKQTFGKKLHELIFTGITTIRMKGKRKFQVKIPNCPALRNTAKTTAAAATDSKQGQDCPVVTDAHTEKGSTVTVDLQPLDTSSWVFVQQQSMNPRLRVSLQADRKVEELLSFIASRWHVSEQKHARSVQLFSHPLSVPPSVVITSPRSRSLTSPPPPSNVTTTPPRPHPLVSKSKEESTKAATKTTTSHVPQPLQISSDMTISNLQHKLSQQSSTSLTLRYRILYDKTAQEEGLDSLLRLAEFLLSAEHSQSSQEHRQLASTPPTGVGGSVLVTSPSVAEYIRSLPKRSPVKSPLAKYRRMKQLRQQSPLRMSAERRHNKVATRLNFEPGQTSNNSSAAVEGSTSSFLSVTPPPGIQRMTLPDLSQSAPQIRTRDSAQDGLEPLTSPQATPLEGTSPVALSNTGRGKRNKMKEPQKTHLVTVSKKSLRSSGSFSRLDLSNIFTAVSQNLKDANMNKAQLELPATSNSSASVAPTTSSTQRQSVVASPTPSRAQVSILTPVGLTAQQPLATDSGRAEALREGVTVSNPSPLEQLATEVVGHPLTPANLTTSASSQMSKTAPSSTTTATVSSFVAPLRKPTRRITKPRTTTKSSHHTPRPVIPKPLRYLPNMTQQQLTPQILSNIAPSSSSFITAPITAQPQNMPTVQTSPKSLVAGGRSLNHSPSQVRPIQSVAAAGNVTPQALQAQMISLLQSMLQQQMRTSQQGAAKQQQQQTSTQPMELLSNTAVSSATTAIQSLSSANMPTTNPPLTPFPPSTSVSPGTASLDLDQLIDPLMPSSEPVHTSSDTVNELLRGLYSTSREEQQQESLKRLSEETADVLPTFAKAVIQMGSSSGSQQPSPSPVVGADNDGAGQLKDSSGSSDSLLAFLQGESSATGTDSNLKQLTDQVDFTDVFSQLKDIICTPEKQRDPISYRPSVQHDRERTDWDAPGPSSSSLDTENSLNVILADLLNSPYKQLARDPSVTSVSRSSSHTVINDSAEHEMQPQSGESCSNNTTTTSGGEMSLRSILEENSVDYITRFKELASTMNQSST